MLFDTERTVVRHLQENDLDLFHDMQGNPNVMRYIKKTMTLDESKKELCRFINSYNDSTHYFRIWAVEAKANHTFLGICGVYENKKSEFEIAYRLRELFWGQGLAKEIASGLIEYCFETIGLEEITAYASKDNVGSVRILEKEMRYAFEFYSQQEKSTERKYRLRREEWFRSAR